MEVSGQFHAQITLSLGKSPRYPVDRRLGGPHSQCGCCEEEKNLSPAGDQTPDVQVIALQYAD
jgi:hypothetical protein